ncbi:MAG: efflux RND transporter periplasmic adaptor subunit [Deltaproteobacteria bacterium]|nr:efflux RND transporter periplasmic adaptor subunit [Deltaproteobacteria bacterium]
MNKVQSRIVSVTALVLAAACAKGAGGDASGGGGRGGAGGARVVPVVATTVQKMDVPLYLDGLGTVAASYTVTVRPQVDGKLEKVLFREGSVVRRGEVLAQIDPRPFEAQLHQAQGALARDEAQLKNAQLNLSRQQDLRNQKLTAQQAVDDAQATVGQLEGTVLVDRAQVESARLNLDYAKITAPIDGVTGVRLVDPGNVVRASDAARAVVVVAQLDPIAVIFTLPQDALADVSREMLKGQLTVDAYSRDGSARLGSGTLTLIDNQINTATATLKLKAMFPNPNKALWPNQFVKARLLVATQKDALAVPATAVQRGPEGTFAWLVGADQTVASKPIEVERIVGDLAILSKGLSPGDTVVLEGAAALRGGAKVAVRMAGEKQGGKAREGAAAAGQNDGGSNGSGHGGHRGKSQADASSNDKKPGSAEP